MVGAMVLDTATVDFTYTDAAHQLTADVKDGSIAYAKMQAVSATDRLLGRSSAGAGVVQEVVCTAAGRALLDDADAAAQRLTLGLGTAAQQAYTEGTFTLTGTGFSGTAPTVTVRYVQVGKQVTLHPQGGLSGTSNATTFTVTGVPAALWPSASFFAWVSALDNGAGVAASVFVDAASGTWSLFKDSGAGWTASGTKQVRGMVLTYVLP